MTIYFILIVFMGFFATGFHYSVLGAAWPVIYQELGVSVSLLSYANMLRVMARVLGGFLCHKLVKKVGTFKASALGFGLICLSLTGYAFCGNYTMLCIAGIPAGFGESFFICSLNELAAIRFKAKYVNWMNMTWSLANAVGPYVMTFCLTRGISWNFGFLVILTIQLVLFVIYLAAYPLWKKLPDGGGAAKTEETEKAVSPLKLKGIYIMMAALFCYIAIENVSGLWMSSYIAVEKQFPEAVAALGTTFLFIGMTAGRLVCGFLSDRLSDRGMMYLGQTGVVLGAFALAFLPGKAAILAAAALFGLGCAPVYPCFVHYIPQVFGKENTGSVLGLITGFSQIAALLLPTVFGWIARLGGIWMYPYMQMLFALLMMGLLIYQKKRIGTRGI